MTSERESGEPAPLIAVLDYGIGNLHSAQKAFEVVGADARLTSDHGLVADADGVVLPGVGAFGACMDALRSSGLTDTTLEAVGSGRPFLGICVGMQMLFSGSQELGPTPAHGEPGAVVDGLDVIPGTVEWIPAGTHKVPQMQWNRLDVVRPDPVLAGLESDSWMYFVHSLHGVPTDDAHVAATVDYGITVNAAFRRDNVFAVQFHPEKSGEAGLHLLRNFLDACSRNDDTDGS